MAARGRKSFATELRIREQTKRLYLNGLSATGIRDALASPQNPEPIHLSLRQVQAYLLKIRTDWAQAIQPEAADEQCAALIAATDDVIFTAAASSARYRDSSLGVGYLNTELKGIRQKAQLLGLDQLRRGAPGRTVSATPLSAHPLDELSAAEQAQRLRELAEALEETA
jgi:hypothetical protein